MQRGELTPREGGKRSEGEGKCSGGRRGGVGENAGAAGVVRERGCGRTDLLPGSHVPPARNGGGQRRGMAGSEEEENEEE